MAAWQICNSTLNEPRIVRRNAPSITIKTRRSVTEFRSISRLRSVVNSSAVRIRCAHPPCAASPFAYRLATRVRKLSRASSLFASRYRERAHNSHVLHNHWKDGTSAGLHIELCAPLAILRKLPPVTNCAAVKHSASTEDYEARNCHHQLCGRRIR